MEGPISDREGLSFDANPGTDLERHVERDISPRLVASVTSARSTSEGLPTNLRPIPAFVSPMTNRR
ncbi:hypothetical protein ACTU45_27660, partial [Streptomyces sp. 24-1644]|uniref:hypothetical protein n=1 Tax=Streptomyces sp. 24-1644 TaxID=3457315 RepID=UPI003FA798CA